MINKVFMQGRLTRDPEMFATKNGHTICKFTLANNQKFSDKEEVQFWDCTAFGKTAEACGRYLGKGSLCFVEGRLACEKWTGKDGQEKQKNSITSEKVEFLTRPDNQQSRQPQYQQNQYQQQQPPAYNHNQQPAQANPAIQEAITQAIVDQHGQQGQQESQEDFIPF